MPDNQCSTAYASECYNPTLAHCGGLSLKFDGKELKLEGGTKIYTYPAVSGKIDVNGCFDYGGYRQTLRSLGPIPIGAYWIKPSEIAERHFWNRSWNESAWGRFRITIHPFTTTVTHGRGGFFIHGGSAAGSAGCIDLTTKIDDFIRNLRSEVDSNTECQIHLTVAY